MSPELLFKAPTLAEYRAQCDRESCTCGAKLSKGIKADPHSNGWNVEGFGSKQWLSVTCPGCEVDWSLEHLGVPRPLGRRTLAERAKLDPHLSVSSE